MRRTILILTIVTMLSGFVFGQSKAEQEVRQTLDAIAVALVKNDLTVLSNHYADSYTFTNAQGETIGKAERLELIKNSKRELFTYGDMTIRVFGNTAVINSNPTFISIGADGQKTNIKDRNTITMVKDGGRWQIVAVQSSNNLLAQSGGSDDVPVIRQTITDLTNALSRNDVETIGRIYADDYQITLQDGTTTMKSERINAMKSGALKYQSLVANDLKIRQYGNAAVANYRVTGKALTTGGEQNLNHQATVTLVKNGGRWQVVSSQLTNIAAK
ncbi:MAG: nuclear transport factor 2 family protein [Pyrinomonadaceae bacterium]|nr:nuclear transport factor 2 family protein [Pyrinomonadaceae bacterium]